MSNTIIIVDHIGKKYIIDHQIQGGWKPKPRHYVALRDVVADNIKSFGRHWFKKEQRTRYEKEEFWALKDLSFKVCRGEVTGIIGHNGAGKSTLLKILSRITEPTTGKIELRGRVASLLEVGTGFHPELTGRENIYLNGSVLGMKRVEIRKKFDEIVDFAEVQKFLDTPVKRYSSGMYVRLAFAVAAHLEPEILVVDEVLAVGDAAFQKKCLGKMEEVATKEGRTVLFVSHNLATIQNLCAKSILLQEGRIVSYEQTNKVVDCYSKRLSDNTKIKIKDRKDRKGNGRFKFLSVEFLTDKKNPVNSILSGETLHIKIKYNSSFLLKLDSHRVSIGFKDQIGNFLFNCPSDISFTAPHQTSVSDRTSNYIVCTIPKLPLTEGIYRFNLFSSVNNEITDWIQDAGILQVIAGDFYKTGKLPPINNQGVLVDFTWDFYKSET